MWFDIIMNSSIELRGSYHIVYRISFYYLKFWGMNRTELSGIRSWLVPDSNPELKIEEFFYEYFYLAEG